MHEEALQPISLCPRHFTAVTPFPASMHSSMSTIFNLARHHVYNGTPCSGRLLIPLLLHLFPPASMQVHHSINTSPFSIYTSQVVPRHHSSNKKILNDAMGAGYRRPPAIAGYHCAFKFFLCIEWWVGTTTPSSNHEQK